MTKGIEVTTASGSRRRHVGGQQSAMILGTLALTAIAVHLAARSAWVSEIVLAIVGLGMTAAVLTGIYRYQPEKPAFWWCVLICGAAYSTGAAIRMNPVSRADPSILLLSDLISLVGAVIAVTALAACWLRQPASRIDFHLLLDTVLIALGGLLASWTTLISPALRAGQGGAVENAIAVAFPIIDAGLLALLMHSIFVSTRNDAALRLVQLAVACVLIGDMGYALDAAGRTDLSSAALLVPHLVGGACIGAAALMPSMVHLNTLRPTHRERSRQRATAVAVVLLVATLVPVIGAGLEFVDRVVMSVLLGALLVGVLIRSERAIKRSSMSERNAQFQADHDKLTGLMNRQALIERFSTEARRDWAGNSVALLFVDLNGFKLVNDTLGHAAGDELIANSAQRIREVVGPDALAARYGGDEFVVAVPTGRRGAGMVADRIVHALTAPFQLHSGPARISASIGIAHTEHELTDATLDQLIRDADSAMYLAKARAVGGYAFYEAVQALDHVIAPTFWDTQPKAVRR